jgi:hypothetical protein
VKIRVGIAVLLCCFSCVGVLRADETGVQAAVDAVHRWYDALGNGSDQDHLNEFGIVGRGVGQLAQAHAQLAAELQKRMDREQFLVHFRGLARMRLLQAHGIKATARDNLVQVFVEEERTMVIEGIPAVAWFQGFVSVTKTADGWRISSLEDVKPEDIIGALDDPGPRHIDPVEVAIAHLQCETTEDCNVMKKALPPNSTERLGRVTIQTPRGTNTVCLVRLHDGEWMAVDTEVETGGASK